VRFFDALNALPGSVLAISSWYVSLEWGADVSAVS